MMRILVFILLTCKLSSFAQTKDLRKRYRDQQATEAYTTKKPSLGSRGLNRLFIDGVIGAGLLSTHQSSYLSKEFGITSDFRIGNNFYLGDGKSPVLIRLTYFRIGPMVSEEGVFPYLVLPELGLAKHFRITETISMEPGIHLGYLLYGDDFYDGGISTFGLYVMPEVKFNFSRFSLGFEYSTRKFGFDGKPSFSWYERYNYVGISLGRRIGKGL
jgi:hypothetical protein